MLLDRELPWCAGRTVRELIVILGGLAVIVAEVLRPGPIDLGNMIVYVAATALFAARFFAARAAAVGSCIGAIVQQWPNLREGEVTLATTAVLPLLGVLLLASRDLVDRFERAPSRVAWLPNPWAGLRAEDTRALRWAAYAAGALSGLLDHTLEMIELQAGVFAMSAPWWPRAAMIVLIAALALLCLGRAVGVLIVWLTAIAVAARTAPLAWQAETVLGLRAPPSELPLMYGYAAPYLLAVLLLAAGAALIVTPSALRLLRRTVL